MKGKDEEIWDDVPDPIEVDLSKLDPQSRLKLLEQYIDQDKARLIVQRIDGSAGDYATNMRRIDQIFGYIVGGLGTAIRIVRAV